MTTSMSNPEPIMDVSVTSSFGSPIMFNPKRGIEASAGVFKDILLGSADKPDSSCNESFHSNADFEDLDHMTKVIAYRACPPSLPLDVRHPPRRPVARRGVSNVDLRRVGAQMSRPHSHSPARIPTRRYSPPQGSTGSGGTRSPEVTPKTSWDHGAANPISTSSPMIQRRQYLPPYYVADTVHDNSVEDCLASGPFYIDHNSSGGSCGNAFPIRHHLQHPTTSKHHHFEHHPVSCLLRATPS